LPWWHETAGEPPLAQALFADIALWRWPSGMKTQFLCNRHQVDVRFR
jgi:hypothetical protein